MRLAYTHSTIPGHLNTTLARLAEVLADGGIRTAGAVQINRTVGAEARCEMDLLILPDGPLVCISQDLGPGSTGCRLDVPTLEQVVGDAAARLAKGVDVVIINKFGKHEADGRGFRDLIAAAISGDVPVVAGVTRTNLQAFLDFAGELAVELPCDVPALAAWVRGETA